MLLMHDDNTICLLKLTEPWRVLHVKTTPLAKAAIGHGHDCGRSNVHSRLAKESLIQHIQTHEKVLTIQIWGV